MLKKTLLATLIAAGVSLSDAQTFAQSTGGSNVTPPVPAQPGSPPGPVKIGYTNVNYLLLASPQTKVIRNQLDVAGRQYEKAIQDRMKELEDKFQAYQRNEATMMESIKQDKQNELRTLETSIRTLQENASQELKNKENELVRPELEKIYAAINDVAKANNYTYVLNSDQVVLFAADGSDISDMVLAKLGYPKPKEGEIGSLSSEGGGSSQPAASSASSNRPAPAARPGGTGRPAPAPNKKKP